MPSRQGSRPSTREQLEATGALCKEHAECYMQTHVSENKGEVAWVKKLFPERKGYLDVYDHYSLCRPRAVFGHGIHLTDDEMQVMHRTGSAIAHCPTSNFFLGSGFFNIQRAIQKERPVRVGLGTDLGAEIGRASCREREKMTVDHVYTKNTSDYKHAPEQL